MSADDIFISPGDRPGARSQDSEARGLGFSLSMPKFRLGRGRGDAHPQQDRTMAPPRQQAVFEPEAPSDYGQAPAYAPDDDYQPAPQPRQAKGQTKAQPKPQPKSRPKRKPRRPPLLSPLQKMAAIGVGIVALATGGFVLWHSGAPQRLARTVADGIWNATSKAGFSVSDITVTGRERTNTQDILTALDARTGTPILSVDLAEAKARLEEVPSVRTATVERRLPHALRVTLVERKPIALWQHDGQFMLVDKDGHQIPGPIDGYESLPLVVGDGAPIASIDLFAMLANEPAIAPRVKAAVRVGSRRWNLRLDDAVKGLEVRLPEDNPEAALHQLAELEKDHGLTNRHVVMIDLRVADKLVVRTSQEQASSQSGESALPSTHHSGG